MHRNTAVEGLTNYVLRGAFVLDLFALLRGKPEARVGFRTELAPFQIRLDRAHPAIGVAALDRGVAIVRRGHLGYLL
jgi:hypothetical protein